MADAAGQAAAWQAPHSKQPTPPAQQAGRQGHRRAGTKRSSQAGWAPTGEAAILQNLEHHVEDIGVRLLNLIKQHHGEGLAPHSLGQLAALPKADVAGGRPDQLADGVALHVLAHVQAHLRAVQGGTGSSGQAVQGAMPCMGAALGSAAARCG